jgi:hypothetical protein
MAAASAYPAQTTPRQSAIDATTHPPVRSQHSRAATRLTDGELLPTVRGQIEGMGFPVTAREG